MSEHTREKQIYKVTLVGSVVNFFLLVFKFIAGTLGHSVAMLADAVHSLSDFVTDIIVLVFVRISGKPQDKDHDYGHGKYETLATAVIGLLLFAAGIGILYNGAVKIADYVNGVQLNEPGMLAFVAALVSVVLKEIIYRYTVIVGKKLDSQTVVANAWHHRSDAFSSVGTAVGIGGALLLGPKWRVLDPLAAVVVSAFIIKVACQLIKNSVGELMEESLPEELENQIENTLKSVPGVYDPHNLRTRKIGNACSVSVHVRMDGNLTVWQSHEITLTIETAIRQILGKDTFVSVHVEPMK